MAENDKTRVEIVIEHIEDVKEHRGEEAYNQMESKCLQDISVSAAKLVDSYTNLKSAKAPIITESISTPADVQTFPDGADGMPMGVEVEIAPVQDLHGHDNPWPAGGNKNKAEVRSLDEVFNNVTLKTIVDAGGNKIGVKANGTCNKNESESITASIVPQESATLYFAVYADKTYNNTDDLYWLIWDATASSSLATNQTVGTTKSVEVTAGHSIVIGLYFKNGAVINDNFYPIMTESVDDIASFTPYSNICPITGHTGANVYRTGKNLFGGSELKSKLQTITGATTGTDTVGDYVAFAGSSAMSGIPLFDKFKANTQYTVILKYKKSNTNTASNIAFLYSDGTFGYINSQETAAEGALYTAVITSTSGKTITDIRAIYASGGTTVYYNLCGVFEGVLTADEFAPYTGNTYPITFPTPPGTVYGGTLTIHQDGSGELVVDRVVDTITKDSEWYGFSTGTGNSSAVVQLTDYQNCKYVEGSSSRNGAISSTGKEAQNYWVNARQNEASNDGDMCFAYSSGGQLRFHRTDVSAITDLDKFETNFPDTQIVYPLATPVTYQLTNQQVIQLLSFNNIWADTGKINAVDYPADTKLYIDKKLTELQALVLEN